MSKPASSPTAGYKAVVTGKEYDIEMGDVMTANTDVGLVAGTTTKKMLHIDFIRKVYGILSAQLVLTATIAYLCTFGNRQAFINAYSWGQYPLLFANFGLLFATYAIRKRSPYNFIALFAWTASMAISIGVVAAVYVEAGETSLIFEAIGITAVMFISLTVFAFQSKVDFTFMRAGLFLLLSIMFWFSILGWIVGITMPLAYSFLGVLLFSGYIIYDTSVIIHNFEPDEYINGAIQLYLDVLNVFLYVLKILSKKK